MTKLSTTVPKKYFNVVKQKKKEQFVQSITQLLTESSKIGKKWKKYGSFATQTDSKFNPKSTDASTPNPL